MTPGVRRLAIVMAAFSHCGQTPSVLVALSCFSMDRHVRTRSWGGEGVHADSPSRTTVVGTSGLCRHKGVVHALFLRI